MIHPTRRSARSVRLRAEVRRDKDVTVAPKPLPPSALTSILPSPCGRGWSPERFLDDDGLHADELGYGVMGERLAAELSAAPPALGASSHSPQATSSAP